MPDTQLRLLTSTAELEALLPQWQALFAADPKATPFQSPEWLLPWWRAFTQPELRTLTLTNPAGELLALIPLYLYPGQNPAEAEPRILPLGAGTSDFLDGLAHPECPPEALAEALSVLDHPVTFTQIRPTSPLIPALQRLGTQQFPGEPTSTLPAAGPQAWHNKIRLNFRNALHKAERLAPVTLETCGPDDWKPAFQLLLDLHTARWQARGEPGVLADPAVLAHHREALPLLLRAGLARLSTLRLDCKAVAVLYSLLDPPTCPSRTEYCYLIGFSAEYAHLSPGTLTLGLLLQRAADEGFVTVDLLRGNERYKSLWHATPNPTLGFNLP